MIVHGLPTARTPEAGLTRVIPKFIFKRMTIAANGLDSTGQINFRKQAPRRVVMVLRMPAYDLSSNFQTEMENKN